MKQFPENKGTLHSSYNYSLGIKIQSEDNTMNLQSSKETSNKGFSYQKNRTKVLTKRILREKRGV